MAVASPGPDGERPDRAAVRFFLWHYPLPSVCKYRELCYHSASLNQTQTDQDGTMINQFQSTPRLVFGEDSLEVLGNEIEALGGSRALLVGDPFLTETAQKVAADLDQRGLACQVYLGVGPEPSPDMAEAAAQSAREHNCEVVVGLGGGSALDTAKAAAILVTNGGRVADYLGLDKVHRAGLPKIMIPTTAGTGAEVTFTAVFTDRTAGWKGGINSRFLYPETAILDPKLTYTLPADITAFTGLDALTHAMEAYLGRAANILTDLYAEKAVELITANLRQAAAEPTSAEARREMLMGSLLAGMALAGAGVGAAHALAYPLGAMFDVPHGKANSMLLPHVLAFNLPDCASRLVRLGRLMKLPLRPGAVEVQAKDTVDAVFELVTDLGVPRTLEELNVPRQALPEMAAKALAVERPIANNPRTVDQNDLLSIFETIYE
jgi:alcohol dehydrogenase